MTEDNTPKILGEATEEEVGALNELRRQADQIVYQIGALDVQKMRLYNALDQGEQQMRVVTSGIGTRLELPSDVQWFVTADGKIVQSK